MAFQTDRERLESVRNSIEGEMDRLKAEDWPTWMVREYREVLDAIRQLPEAAPHTGLSEFEQRRAARDAS